MQFSNKNKDALVDGKEHDDDIQKSVSPDIHFLSSGAQTRKQGDKTENKDKGKSHVVPITGFRDLNVEFEECTNNSTSTPIDAEKPLLKDSDGEDVDVHTYRSMIGSLMYLTSSRPDIMFADSSFDLVAYSDSDYAGASLDRKSTTGGCQFLGCRLISWQCKKQSVVATSSTEAEYVAATSGCAQVLWIQNQLLDYGD
nr:putative ribonuclease H-like domain-containing protein [Tanacetum cinerariifolium]